MSSPETASSSPSSSLAGERIPTDRTPTARRPALQAKVESLRLSRDQRDGRLTGRLPWFVCLVLVTACVYLVNDRLELQRQLASGVGSSESSTDDSDPDAAGTSGTAANSSAAAPSPGGDATTSQTGSTGSGKDPGSYPGRALVLQAKGYIIPAHQILVSPKVSGMLLKVNIEEGVRVRKGQTLAEVERTEYEADLQRATAQRSQAEQRLLELKNGTRPQEKEQAKAELDEMSANLDQLRSTWERARRLVTSKAISVDDYQVAESQFKMVERRVERLKAAYDLAIIGPRQEKIDLAAAELAQANADVAKAQWRFDNCTVRAPISGTILKKNAEEGNMVNPGAFNGSFSLCEMADLSDLEVDLSIQERDIARIFRDQECEVAADAWPNRKYVGYVSRLMPIADRAKASVSVRVKLAIPADEEGVYLKPDMGAIVSFFSTKVTPPVLKTGSAAAMTTPASTPLPGPPQPNPTPVATPRDTPSASTPAATIPAATTPAPAETASPAAASPATAPAAATDKPTPAATVPAANEPAVKSPARAAAAAAKES